MSDQQLMEREDDALAEYGQAASRAFSGKAPDQDLSPLGNIFLAEFAQAEKDREPTEQRWLQDLRQYRGKYDPEELAAIGSTRSKSFVRKTRVKVKTVDSRVADLLFPAGTDKNWDVAPTPVPSVSDEERAEVEARLMEQALASAQQQAQASGAPVDPAKIPRPPAKIVDDIIMAQVKAASKEMSKTIEDQLVEARYKKQALQVLHSGHLYGTGVLKGPLVEKRLRTRFHKETTTDAAGNKKAAWVPKTEQYVTPFVDYVPLWRFYPDMGATELQQCRFAYERHTFNQADLFELSKRRSFKGGLIVAHIAANPQGSVQSRYFDGELKEIGERQSKQGDTCGQYEVLERWGWIEGSKLKQAGVNVPTEREQETFFSNVWLLPNGTIIKAVLQPINGVTWPYHMYYFDKDETSIFGEGLAAVMRDDQKMLNAATRLMIDNAAITSGPMFEVAVGLLASADKATEMAPWKVFLRNAKDMAHPAVRPISVENNLEWLDKMSRKFDENADEVTAVPRYMSGENATSGAAGTMGGLSMLMGAVNIVIKDLITGYDEGITTPFLQALYHWNMQFNPNDKIKGDFDVYARGTASLVAKEIRAQQLNEFSTLTNNPLDAPFIKRHKLNQLRAEALELSDVVLTEDEVKAEQESEQGQKQRAIQEELVLAQLGEQKAKTAKTLAEAEVAKTKVTEMLARLETMAIEMQQAEAQRDKTIAETVSIKVQAVFAALQAGGVATLNPTTAPAGDEILRSAGFKDENGDPTIAQLNGPPVQADQGTMVRMNKGQSFTQEPRGDMPVPLDGADAGDNRPDIPAPQPAQVAANPMEGGAEPQTGMVGREAGIETAAIEA